MAMRTVGVEEELMLIDPSSGALRPVAANVLRAATGTVGRPTRVGGGLAHDRIDVQHELYLEQIEVATPPCRTLTEVETRLRRGRRLVGEAARSAGVASVAVATPVLPSSGGTVTPHRRYQEIVGQYGEGARESLVCAMHVHVGVVSEQEAVAVIDRIRPWLPVLLALSANSPYWRGVDTGYASWRSQLWGRWPTSGPVDLFGDPQTYHAITEQILDAGAALDAGMLYFDARLSVGNPTVEVRVADVCTEVEDALLVAALVRALVETAAREWRRGESPADWRTDQLRVAAWRAAKSGVTDRLVHPVDRGVAAVADVLTSVAEHVGDALDESGDTQIVCSGFERILTAGNGADRQRSAFDAGGDLVAVVGDLRRRTEASWS
jgi:glutamate---cysteine ligase / carboxylate-amine ligase